LQSLARTVPANGRMGIFLDGDDWDFPLFGPHLDRYVQPLVLPPGADRYVTHAGPGTPDYILTHQAPQAVRLLLRDPRLSHCSMLWSIGQGNGAAPWQLFRCSAHTAS
jgi:hypothetical protein